MNVGVLFIVAFVSCVTAQEAPSPDAVPKPEVAAPTNGSVNTRIFGGPAGVGNLVNNLAHSVGAGLSGLLQPLNGLGLVQPGGFGGNPIHFPNQGVGGHGGQSGFGGHGGHGSQGGFGGHGGQSGFGGHGGQGGFGGHGGQGGFGGHGGQSGFGGHGGQGGFGGHGGQGGFGGHGGQSGFGGHGGQGGFGGHGGQSGFGGGGRPGGFGRPNRPGQGFGGKPGACPPIRPSCPSTKINNQPIVCFGDHQCAGIQKCCPDVCLQPDLICKTPI